MANGDEPHDLTLHLLDDSELRCHRAILRGHGKFSLNSLKPSKLKETSPGVIELKHDPPQAVRCMIEFLYTGKYFVGDFARKKEANRPAANWSSVAWFFSRKNFSRKNFANEVVGHARVYVIAKIYDAIFLQTTARVHIYYALKRKRMVDVFAEVVKIIYGGVPEVDINVETALMRFAKRNMVALIRGGQYQRLVDMAPKFMGEAVEMYLPAHILKRNNFGTREELLETFRLRVEEANHLKPLKKSPR